MSYEENKFLCELFEVLFEKKGAPGAKTFLLEENT